MQRAGLDPPRVGSPDQPHSAGGSQTQEDLHTPKQEIPSKMSKNVQQCAGWGLISHSPRKLESLISSVCQLLWCKYFHHGQFKVTSVMLLITHLGIDGHCQCTP